jgi:phage FluMu protein Com
MKSLDPLSQHRDKEYLAVRCSNKECNDVMALIEVHPEMLDRYGSLILEKDDEVLQVTCPLCKTISVCQTRQMIRLIPRSKR